MPSVDILRQSDIARTARVLQIEGIFDVAPTEKSVETWHCDLPIEDFEWNIGLIVGPSGCGKTTLANEIWHEHVVRSHEWSDDKCIIDCFPVDMSVRDVTMLLSSVGFSSPPLWLRPFNVLSNGEKFRVMMARALAEERELCVMDEFTSVVDRTVAKIGSCAVSKAVRRSGRKFVALSCHYDIVEWLEPDWVYQPHTNEFKRGRLRRPNIEITIRRVDKVAWQLFRKYHYLDSTLHQAAACFVGFVEDNPAAFTAVLHFPHPTASGYREHRTVCLPDFQGVGIGNAMSEYVAGLYAATGKPYRSTTSNPAMIYHRAKSLNWNMIRKPTMLGHHTGLKDFKSSFGRLTSSFVWRGQRNINDAKAFGIV